MNLNIDIGLRGIFVVKVIDAKTKQVKREQDPVRNLITDSGLNYYGTNAGLGLNYISNGWLGVCHAGTSSTAPANGDTTLVAQASGTSGYSVTYVNGECGTSYDDATKTFTLWRTFDFSSPGSLTTYREVGVGPNSVLVNNRALINGGAGVAVDTDEQLRVFFQLELTVNGPFQSTPRPNLITLPGPTYIDGDWSMQWFPAIGDLPLVGIDSSGSQDTTDHSALLEPGRTAGTSYSQQFWMSTSNKPIPAGTLWNQTYVSADHNYGLNSGGSSASVYYGAASIGSYSAGTFTRTKSVTFTPTLGAMSNIRIFGIGGVISSVASTSWSTGCQAVAVLDSAFTKSATQRATLRLVYTWARV